MLGVVASFVAAQPPQPDWKTIHKALGLALKTHVKGSSDNRLWSDQEEAIHHLHVAKEGNMAWPLVEEYVIRRRDRAQYLEDLEILWYSAVADASGNQLAPSLVFRVQIQCRLGTDLAEAELHLERALRLSSSGEGRPGRSMPGTLNIPGP